LSETQQLSEKHIDEKYMEEEWLDIYAKNTSDESTINSQLTQPSQTVVELTNTQSSDITLHTANFETPHRTSCSETFAHLRLLVQILLRLQELAAYILYIR